MQDMDDDLGMSTATYKKDLARMQSFKQKKDELKSHEKFYNTDFIERKLSNKE